MTSDPPRNPPHPEPALAICPRCRYDQSGALAAMQSQPAWPLRTRCTECGLDFLWADVLYPARNDLPWLFEHAPGWALGIGRALWTWSYALVPRLFWTRLRLEAPVRVGRLLAWLVVICGPIFLLTALANLWRLYGVWRQNQALPPGMRWTLDWPEEIFNAVFLPFIQIDAAWGPLGAASPWARLSSPALRELPYALSGPLAALPIVPLILLLLGRSRAMARVHPGHILRTAIYQFAVFIPLYALFAVQVIWVRFGAVPGFGMTRGPMNWLLGWPLPFLALLLLAWYAWYWYEAVVRGLRLERGPLIWGLLMIAAFLLAFIAALSDPQFYRLMGWL